jgi:hypothetical protein
VPNVTRVPRPLIFLIYNAAAVRALDPGLDLAGRTPGQVRWYRKSCVSRRICIMDC